MTNKKQDTSQNFGYKLGEFVVKYKWLVLIASIALTMALASQGRMEFDGDYHVFFAKSNPELEAFDALQEKYTKDDNILIVLEPKEGDLFTREHLAAIEELTSMAWNTPYSSRVDAITNFQHTRAEGDDLFVDDLSYDSAGKTDTEINEIKAIALNEPLLVNRLINETGTVTGINITVKLPGVDSAVEIPEVIQSTRKMLDDFQVKHPQFNVYTTGMVPLNTAFFESSQNDLALTMLMLGIVVLITLLLTRNIFAMVATLMVILFSIMSAVGFVGIMGIKLTPPSAVFPTMMVPLAVADSIHILITYLQKARKEGYSKQLAICESLRINFGPVFITSITTVVGFLTMNFGDVPPFWHLGNITAFGMVMAFLYSTTLLPALMAIFPMRVKKEQATKETKPSYLIKLSDFVAVRPLAITVLSLAIISILGFWASKNIFNDEFVEYFDQSVPFRVESDFVNDNLTGFYNAEFSLSSGESGGINSPAYLEQLTSFESWLTAQEEVVHVNAYTEVARRINQSMHGNDPAYYRIPDSREEAAQYLLLYELSLPFGLDLNNQVNVDKSETRLTATLRNISSKEIIAFTTRAEAWLKENTSSPMHAYAVSPTIMFSKLGFRQADSMFKGNAFALILITIVLIIALRNLKIGFLSLVANVTPIIVGFGIWYLLKGTINVGMVIVFGMTIGIIVDDTVHFLSKFLRARRELDYNVRQSIQYAFETVGKALITTTIVLVAGFAVLSTSSFAMNSYMARITMIIILAALLIDFLLLPALLVLFDRENKAILKTN